MSLSRSTLVVALLALATGCTAANTVTPSTKLADRAGGAAGVALSNGPRMIEPPPNVDRFEPPIDRSARTTPREPAIFRIENCTRCN